MGQNKQKQPCKHIDNRHLTLSRGVQETIMGGGAESKRQGTHPWGGAASHWWSHSTSFTCRCSRMWTQGSFFFFLSLCSIYSFFFFFYCSGFCHTLKWNSHGFTCVPHPDPLSHLPLHPIPLDLPSAPGPSTCLMHPTWAGDLFHPR